MTIRQVTHLQARTDPDSASEGPGRDRSDDRRVAVAMASYNGARYIEEQLASIAAQTRRPDELIVSDDGSTDGTPELVRAFSRSVDFDVELVQGTTRLGYSRNFERALARTTGDVVFIADQDDVWMPQKIATVLRELKEAPSALLAIHDREATDAKLVASGKTSMGEATRLGRSTGNYVAGCATAIDRRMLDLALPLPEVAGVNYDIWLHALARELDARVDVETTLMHWRRHENVVSASPIWSPVAASRSRYYWALARRVFGDARSGRRLAGVRIASERMRCLAQRLRDPRAARLASGDVQERARALEAHADRLQARVAVMNAAWPRRLRAGYRLLRSGGYSELRGVADYILDLTARNERS